MEHGVVAISFEPTCTSPATRLPSSLPPLGIFTASAPEFIVGPENRLLGAAVQWLLDGEAHGYSPVVLCGASGSGKSHLALGLSFARQEALCVAAADFARELATAVHRKTTSAFQDKYRGAGMLVLEDLSQLAGRTAALVELQHTLDALADRQVPVVITSRVPPSQIAGLPAALASRLGGGLVLSISALGPAARLAILTRLAEAHGVNLSPPAAKLLADELSGPAGVGVTAAELNGALAELMQFVESKAEGGRRKAETVAEELAVESTTLSKQPFSVEYVRKFLAARRSHSRLNLQQLAAVVAKFYGVPLAVLSSASRRQQVVLARAVAIYLGRTLMRASLQSLGKQFGGRDHTTALHSFRSIQKRLATDAELRGAIGSLTTLVEER